MQCLKGASHAAETQRQQEPNPGSLVEVDSPGSGRGRSHLQWAGRQGLGAGGLPGLGLP